MPQYDFMDYAPSGKSAIADWLSGFREDLRIDVRSALVAIIQQAWTIDVLKLPRFERLSGRYRDLIAVRFKVHGVERRVIGHAGGTPPEMWLLIGGEERNGHYLPPSILDTALKRMNAVKQDHRLVRRTCILEDDN